MSKIKLGVNIDHIAFIKKSRDTKYPDLREAVSICVKQRPLLEYQIKSLVKQSYFHFALFFKSPFL